MLSNGDANPENEAIPKKVRKDKKPLENTSRGCNNNDDDKKRKHPTISDRFRDYVQSLIKGLVKGEATEYLIDRLSLSYLGELPLVIFSIISEHDGIYVDHLKNVVDTILLKLLPIFCHKYA